MVWDFGGLRFGSSQVDTLLVYYAALANNQNQYTCFGHASEHEKNLEHFTFIKWEAFYVKNDFSFWNKYKSIRLLNTAIE